MAVEGHDEPASRIRAAPSRGSARVARAVLVAVTIVVWLALVRLAAAFVGNELSWRYVAEQSRTDAPWYYRLAGVWGGMDGSLLLFTGILGVVAAVGGWRSNAVASWWAAGTVGALALVDVVLASPFGRLDAPAVRGFGLTPILEHPAMVVHPPLLYVGLACAFGAFVGGLGGGEPWRIARPWLLATIGVLTLAMALGAAWSYMEQGWGGYWAWDPVENTSLMVWLAAIVAVHGVADHRFAMAAHGVRHRPVGARSGRGDDRALGAQPFGPRLRRAGERRLGAARRLAGHARRSRRCRAARPLRRRPSDDPETPAGRRSGHHRGAGRRGDARRVGRDDRAGGRRARRRAGDGGPRRVLRSNRRADGARRRSVPGPPLPPVAGLEHGRPRRRARAAGRHRRLDVRSSGHRARRAGATVEAAGRDVRNDGVEVVEGPRPGTDAVVADLVVDGRSMRPALVAYPDRGGRLAETAVRSTPLTDVQAILDGAADDGGVVVTIHVRHLMWLVWSGGAVVAVATLAASRRPEPS